MSKPLLIKAPDGRVIKAPRHLTTTVVVDDDPVTSINEAALKAGWSIAPALAAPVKKGS